MPYRLSALAEQDLEEIWSYVAEDASPETADRLIDAIFDRFALLVEQPRMGRNRPEFGEGVRSFVVESYVIYYRARAPGQPHRGSRLAHADRPVLVDQSVWKAADGLIDVDPQPALAQGYEIGPYRVGRLLGIGGMGHVYRARDTKLQRDVALKILPDAFVQDPDQVARFTREAHVLASLNHTNIGAIYGFESSDHIHALVLELVDAPTLEDRITRGALPLDEAIAIARQIVDALEAAIPTGSIAIIRVAAGHHRSRSDRWDRSLHESRAGKRNGMRQAQRHLGLRMRLVRDVGGQARLRWSRRRGHNCVNHRART